MRGRFLALTALLVLAGCNKSTPGETAPTNAATPAVALSGIAEKLAQDNVGAAVDDAKMLIAAEPDNAEAYLLLARGEARQDNAGNAVAALETAFNKGFHDPRGALGHPDFDRLRDNRSFVALARRYGTQRSAASSAPRRPAVETSVIRAGDVSIMESSDGHGRIRAGDVVIED